MVRERARKLREDGEEQCTDMIKQVTLLFGHPVHLFLLLYFLQKQSAEIIHRHFKQSYREEKQIPFVDIFVCVRSALLKTNLRMVKYIGCPKKIINKSISYFLKACEDVEEFTESEDFCLGNHMTTDR